MEIYYNLQSLKIPRSKRARKKYLKKIGLYKKYKKYEISDRVQTIGTDPLLIYDEITEYSEELINFNMNGIDIKASKSIKEKLENNGK